MPTQNSFAQKQNSRTATVYPAVPYSPALRCSSLWWRFYHRHTSVCERQQSFELNVSM